MMGIGHHLASSSRRDNGDQIALVGNIEHEHTRAEQDTNRITVPLPGMEMVLFGTSWRGIGVPIPRTAFVNPMPTRRVELRTY